MFIDTSAGPRYQISALGGAQGEDPCPEPWEIENPRENPPPLLRARNPSAGGQGGAGGSQMHCIRYFNLFTSEAEIL